ncbi:hypothetical protein DVA67_008795 [Solirubrobacter sp. CPCC 204708]|nr:hypothetical protein [Solirubrobacter deserti]
MTDRGSLAGDDHAAPGHTGPSRGDAVDDELQRLRAQNAPLSARSRAGCSGAASTSRRWRVRRCPSGRT